jgi:broad specificity phosphatase PhoE
MMESDRGEERQNPNLARIWFITHPEVVVDPYTPVPQWSLSERGIERMKTFCRREDLSDIRAIWSSAETKAIEGAEILASYLGICCKLEERLHENDRSATGYLPADDFEAMANRFFANPEQSVEGWERAVDSQSRIVAAVDAIVAQHIDGGDLAIVAHGGVGALLLDALRRLPISRGLDQPGRGGGIFSYLHPRLTQFCRNGPISPNRTECCPTDVCL